MLLKITDPKNKKGDQVINVSKAKSQSLTFGVILISKQLVNPTDKVDYELC